VKKNRGSVKWNLKMTGTVSVERNWAVKIEDITSLCVVTGAGVSGEIIVDSACKDFGMRFHSRDFFLDGVRAASAGQ
jgi:hypothetical protein